MNKLTRKFPSWSETECDECGCTFQVTRSEPKEVTGKIICSDCEMYQRGYADAEKEYVNKIEVNEATIVELCNALKLAKEMFVCNDMILPHTFEVIDSALEKVEK